MHRVLVIPALALTGVTVILGVLTAQAWLCVVGRELNTRWAKKNGVALWNPPA